jgi:manganese/iron transport system ATP-binding protein
VLAAGPTAEVFTQANLERAFGGVLRHFVLKESDLGSGPGRAVGFISDDERPFILYEGSADPRSSAAPAGGDPAP